MANTETSVSNLKINRLTQTQLENASSLSNTEAYWVDPEFTGGKLLATDSNGDIVESTVAPADIGTVKSVNSTSPDSNGNVSITIPSEVTETTVSNWGFTKNTGTVTSVNNVTPVGGNVTIPVGDTLPSQTGNANKVLGTNGTTASWVEQYSRNIGEIVQSTIPLTDAGLHLLDGSLLSGSGVYGDFVDYIADLYDSGDYTAIFDTEANWQTSVTTYCVCGKFVYDSVNNTVRLPKYNSKIYTGGGEAQVKGNGKTIGLTDGTNNVGMETYITVQNDFVQLATSVYDTPVGTTRGVAIYSGKSVGVTTDGTKSGIIADLSNITTSVDGYYYIVVATSTKTDIQVDIDEIATDLNGKADVDLTNCTKPHIVETYINGTSWYRIYSDGWCEQGGRYTQTSTEVSSIIFLKEFKDTNYIFSRSGFWNNATYGYVGYGNGESAKLTTGVTIYSTTNADYYDWQACGYLASGQY